MTSRAVRSEFKHRGVVTASGQVFDDETALSLIDRAERDYVAVSSVEPIRAVDLSAYAPPEAPSLTDLERLRSWSSARDFVKSLSGRELYFDVILESPWATFLAKLRYMFRNSGPWDPDDRGRRTPPMVG
jgi:hypothetical protein